MKQYQSLINYCVLDTNADDDSNYNCTVLDIIVVYLKNYFEYINLDNDAGKFISIITFMLKRKWMMIQSKMMIMKVMLTMTMMVMMTVMMMITLT